MARQRATYITRTLQKVKAELNHHIVLVSQDLRDLPGNPPVAPILISIVPSHILQPASLAGYGTHSLLHHLDVHLGHIDLPIELRRKLGLPEHFGIHAGRHRAPQAYSAAIVERDSGFQRGCWRVKERLEAAVVEVELWALRFGSLAADVC